MLFSFGRVGSCHTTFPGYLGTSYKKRECIFILSCMLHGTSLKIETLSIVIPLFYDQPAEVASALHPLCCGLVRHGPLSPISEPLFVPLSCCCCWARVCTSPSLVTSQQSKIEILLFPGGNYYFPVQCPVRGRGRALVRHP